MDSKEFLPTKRSFDVGGESLWTARKLRSYKVWTAQRIQINLLAVVDRTVDRKV